jgi:hypothetical protein
MKKLTLFIFFFVFICIDKNAKAQITLEHTYVGAFGQVYIVDIETYGQKYCWRDWAAGYVRLYNLDHSVFRAMPLPVVPFTVMYQRAILYVTKDLFSCSDDYIEYMYSYMDSTILPYRNSTRIVNELGNVIMAADSFAPLVAANVPQTQVPIYNTPLGTKMILSGGANSTSNDARVYSLCGILTTSIEPVNFSSEDISTLSAFPNPSSNQTTIEYQFPPGITSGEIILYDMNGVEVKRYKVDSMFSNILLDNSSLKSGTYFYQLAASGNIIGTKKMVVIK